MNSQSIISMQASNICFNYTDVVITCENKGMWVYEGVFVSTLSRHGKDISVPYHVMCAYRQLTLVV